MRNSEFYSRNKKKKNSILFIAFYSDWRPGNFTYCWKLLCISSSVRSLRQGCFTWPEVLCNFFFLFSSFLFACSLLKQAVNIKSRLGCRNSTHCLTVTSLIILLQYYVLRLIWTFCVMVLFCLFFFFLVYLLPSHTVGRFCSVWNMILKSFTHLNFRVTEKKKTEKTNILSILNTCKNEQTTNICFFLITSNVYMIDFI